MTRASRDVSTAIRSAVTLGASLLVTWSAALVVRLVLPRSLGPEVMGPINFADALSATCMVVLNLGVDVYLLRELPVKPSRASELMGAVTTVRFFLGAAMALAVNLVLTTTGRSEATRALVLAFCASQFLLFAGGSLATVLQASSRVAGLALANAVTRGLWLGLILMALWRRGDLVAWVAAAVVIPELVRCAWLWWLCRVNTGLRWTVNPGELGAVLRSSAPFFVNALAGTIYWRVATVLIEARAGSELEVSWYSQAQSLAQVLTIGTPIIFWVLLPLFARSAKRDAEELRQQLRRSVELLLTLVIPLALAVELGAETLLWVVFGPAFAPAVTALQIQAPLVALTYLSTLCAVGLIQLGKPWRVTLISLASLPLNFGLSVWLIGVMAQRLGPGGAGAGAALGLLITEACVAVTMISQMKSWVFDARGVRTLVFSLVICGVVLAVDRVLPFRSVVRLAIDALIYLVLAAVTGVLKPKELIGFVRTAFAQRRGTSAP